MVVEPRCGLLLCAGRIALPAILATVVSSCSSPGGKPPNSNGGAGGAVNPDASMGG